MPKPKIFLYAEALTHIRQLTLHASLQTEKNEHTKILISSDKKIVTALHDGEASSIYLPTQISGTAHVTFPIDKRTEISTRLQIDDVLPLDAEKEVSCGPEVPWSALSLQDGTSISCGHCDACVLPAANVVTWKDLPSENWADLMDFWFCHKPHNSDQADGKTAEETETATAPTRVAASSAVGLVDTVSFLLCREDCTNIEVSSKRRQTPKHTTLSTHWRKERSFSGLPTHCPLIGFLIHSPYIEFVIGHAMAESTSFPSSRWLVC